MPSQIVRPKQGQLRHGRLLALDTDHRGLNKFRSHDDPNFQTFLTVLWQAYDHALKNSKASSTIGMPWATMNKPTAAVLYGLNELAASWLAKDRNKYGHYLTIRVPRMALYGAVVHVPLCSILEPLLNEALNCCTSLSSQGLHLLVINLLVCYLLAYLLATRTMLTQPLSRSRPSST